MVSDSVAPKTSRIKRSLPDLRCLSQRPEPAKTRGMHRVERSAYLVSESQVALAVKDSLSRHSAWSSGKTRGLRQVNMSERSLGGMEEGARVEPQGKRQGRGEEQRA